jgi:glycosyltransferase involved in cell wall biosynthesis
MLHKVSIIIPSYNDGDKLALLLDSISHQTYKNIEILLIDGASADQTKELAEKNSTLINYFISEPDKGIFDAMNKGIMEATGDWLFFIGCDDQFYHHDILKNIFGEKDFGEVDILYGKIFDKKKKAIIGQQINSKEDLINSQFWHQSIFYNKSVFSKTGLYKIEYKIAADSIFNNDAFCNHSLKWAFTNETTTTFSGDGLSSYALDKKYHEDQKKYFFEWFKGLSPELIYDALQHHLYNELKHGNILTAIKEYLIIIRHTKKFQPYTYNFGYWLKYRLKNKPFNV